MLTDDQIHDALSSILERRDPDVPATVLGAGSDDLGVGLRYLEALVDGGWMVPTWPLEHGGRGATDDDQRCGAPSDGINIGQFTHPVPLG